MGRDRDLNPDNHRDEKDAKARLSPETVRPLADVGGL
jgi:hypothetical protein